VSGLLTPAHQKAVAAIAAFAAVLGGCGLLPRNAVPPELVERATIPHLPDIRAWAGRPSPAMERDLAASFEQESAEDFPKGTDGVVNYAHLAISGGGPNGAFGAGLLNGWTTTGKRPVFKIVTGVSTGALMAPFAFVGPSYDGALREFYTTTSSRNIFRALSIIPQLLTGDSLADSGPLASLIDQHVDGLLLARVADAHARGRRLYVGTVDLDAQQFVVWNMGLIAASGRPESLELFRKVMLASASVPIAFPPVFFEVEAGGRGYDEMHVDGAVAARLFLTGGVFDLSIVRKRGGRGPGRENIYVIHNGQLPPVAEQTPRSLRGIASRTLQAAGRAGVVGDLFRLHAVAIATEASLYWITIPEDVEIEGSEVFDPVVMGRLYELGYRKGAEGSPWVTGPPGLRYQQAP
jgi:predicted acylesterase/phospholipase RssA